VATPTAILDARVIYASMPRDLLVRLALAGLYRARWTDAIHDEWTRNLKADRPDLDPAGIDRTRSLMDRAVRDCLVAGYEGLIPSITLPDADDRHVVAAAIHCQADVIVTYNLADFPAEALVPHGLEAVHPDALVIALIAEDQAKVFGAMREMVAALRRPPMTIWQALDALERARMNRTAGWARETIKEATRGMPGFG
jgi:hypothetical protein